MKPVTIPTNAASAKTNWNQYSSSRQIQQALNSQTALNGITVAFTTGPTANTSFDVPHTLGRVPVGYHLVKLAAALTIYDGTGATTKSTISLKATVANTEVSIYLF